MVKENRKKILFITPEAKSNGANIFLLNFLRWFKVNSSIPFCTIYGHGGDLESDFAELSKTYLYALAWQPKNYLGRRLHGVVRRIEAKQRWLKHQIEKENIGLIYSNTVINHQIVDAFSDLNVPVLTHCHELESVIQRTGLEGFIETKRKSSHFIAVSEAVRQNLMVNHQIASEKISLVYGFIPLENWQEEVIAEKRRRITEELNIPPNAFIIGASGTIYWRKAPDIFIQIADKIHKTQPGLPIYFLWIGGARKDDFVFFEMNYDVGKLKLEKYVHFLEHKSNPLDYFAALDVFAMVSREDPFPLVCLEAAGLGKPLICFDEAGGMPEFVENDCGYVVPYLDVEAFADKITTLFYDRELTEKFGNNAAQKVRRQHNIESSAPKILEVIKKHGNF